MATTTTRARVLIVEDEEAARNALAKLLKSEGLDVEVAEDGEVALLKTEERAPDLIVTDVSMPKMDGLELLAKVREKHKDLPVIVVTSAHDLSIAVRAMRAGAEDFITKPIDFDALGFGIPPATLPATDTSQLLALIVAQAVLEDAARDQLASIDRSRISVILGVTSAQAQKPFRACSGDRRQPGGAGGGRVDPAGRDQRRDRAHHRRERHR